MTRVRLVKSEVWPELFVESDDADVDVPAALLDELREARERESRAKRRLCEWVIEHAPESESAETARHVLRG